MATTVDLRQQPGPEPKYWKVYAPPGTPMVHGADGAVRAVTLEVEHGTLIFYGDDMLTEVVYAVAPGHWARVERWGDFVALAEIVGMTAGWVTR